MYSALYIAALGILCFPAGRVLALFNYSTDRFPFHCCGIERGGRLYEKLGIHGWQNKVPDISRLIPGIVPRKAIPGKPDTKTLQTMIKETCVAELTHVLLCMAGLALFWLWPGVGGALFYAVYVLVGNLPFILIQRYNRPRLLHLLQAAQRRERNRSVIQEKTS